MTRYRQQLERHWPLALAAACAVVTGLIAQSVGVPSGLVFGGMIGAAAVTLRLGRPVTMPQPLRAAVMLGMGTLIGMRVTRETVQALAQAFLPSLLAAGLLIVAGVLITVVLRWFDRSPDADLLATSPGALEVLVGLAAEENRNAVQVAMFHLVRIVLVVVLLPLTILLA